MIRLWVNSPLFSGSVISLEERQKHYLLNVMRQKKGDLCLCFNGQDGEWECRIDLLGKKEGALTAMRQTRPQPPLKRECILCPALIKKNEMDLVFQKATELGVTKIIPVLTERTVVRHLNSERSRLILTEAAEQCERLDIPILLSPTPLKDLPKFLSQDETLVYLSERHAPTGPLKNITTPAFLIGPEGGFTDREKAFLTSLPNHLICHLGDTILKAETAALSIISCWQFRNTF